METAQSPVTAEDRNSVLLTFLSKYDARVAEVDLEIAKVAESFSTSPLYAIEHRTKTLAKLSHERVIYARVADYIQKAVDEPEWNTMIRISQLRKRHDRLTTELLETEFSNFSTNMISNMLNLWQKESVRIELSLVKELEEALIPFMSI